jgi:uncharacterized membrane protein YphA (DoxX/SURF4 family)
MSNPSVKSPPSILGWLGVPIRLLIGGLFLWAAWAKIGPSNGPQVFSTAIVAYKLELPDHLVALATFGVPWTEAIAGVLLILGLWTRASAAVIAAMLLLFIGLGLSAISRHLDIHCGCFGDGTLLCKGGLGWCHIGENSLLTALTLLVVLCSRPALALDNACRKSGCCGGSSACGGNCSCKKAPQA